MCLADFASKIDIKYPHHSKENPFNDNVDDIDNLQTNNDTHNAEKNPTKFHHVTQNGLEYKQRNVPKIIYVRYSETLDIENHCRERLLLFLPWRNEQKDLLGGHDSYTSHYNAKKSAIQHQIVKYEHHADILVEAQHRAENEHQLCYDDVAPQHDTLQPIQPSNEFIFYDPNKHGKEQGYDIGVDIGLGPRPTQEDTQELPGRIPDSEYRSLIRKLNHKQSTILKHVLKHKDKS